MPASRVRSVERITTPSAEAFAREYLSRWRPVVLTDLFDAASGRAVDTLEAARVELRDVPLRIQRNYLNAIVFGGDRERPRPCTLGAFLDQLTANPTTEDVCIEHATPAALLERFPLPMHVVAGAIEDSAIDDATSDTFVAGAGNFTHLHYDADQRAVLMHQVFGTKRYVLIHPSETRKLDPLVEPDLQRCSGMALFAMAPADQRAFLDYAQAYDCVLEPGETLLMPPMAWHYVEYCETAMSIGHRLPRPHLNRLLGDALPNPSLSVQRAVVALLEDGDGRLDGERASLEAIVTDADLSAPDRVVAVERVCTDIVRTVCSGESASSYSVRARARWGTTDSRAQLAIGEHAIALAPTVDILAPIGADTGSLHVVHAGRLAARIDEGSESDWVLSVLTCLARNRSPQSIGDLASTAGTTEANVRQLVGQLAARGWVERLPGGAADQ